MNDASQSKFITLLNNISASDFDKNESSFHEICITLHISIFILYYMMEIGRNILEISLAWVAHRRQVGSVLVGATSPEQ